MLMALLGCSMQALIRLRIFIRPMALVRCSMCSMLMMLRMLIMLKTSRVLMTCSILAETFRQSLQSEHSVAAQLAVAAARDREAHGVAEM